MLKRLLSAILTIAMVLSFIPASFASAEETAAPENVKIVYNYQPVAKGTRLSTITSYEQSNGFWRFGSYKAFSGDGASYWNDHSGWHLIHTGGYFQIASKVGYWHGIRFHVPVAGTYSVELAPCVLQNNRSGHFAYAILPGSKTTDEISTFMSDVSWNDETKTLTAPEGVGETDTIYGTENYDSWAKRTFDYTFDEPGEYVFVFQTIKSNPNEPNEYYGSSIYIKNFSLTKGDAASAVSVPMGYTIIDKTELSVGEKAKASASSLLDSVSKEAVTDASITYKSYDESVAEVDANGEVTAKKGGKTKIAAIANGAELVAKEITVKNKPSETKVVYDFSFAPYGWGDKQAPDVFTYEKSHNLWQYYAKSWSGMGEGRINYFSGTGMYLHVAWIAHKVNVPVSGAYVPYQRYGGKSGSGNLDVYMIPAAVLGTSPFNTQIKAAMTDEYKIGSVNCDTGATNQKLAATPYEFEERVFDAGEYYLVYNGGSYTIYSDLVLDGGTGKAVTDFEVTTDANDEILVGDTFNASAAIWYSDATGGALDSGVTYTSSNSNVAKVNATTGKIEAVGEGEAKITVTYGDNSDSISVKVSKYESAPKALSLYVASGNGVVSAKVNGDSVSVDEVAAASQGASVTVTANDTETLRFSHWEGTAGVASFDATYTFDIYTNTALKAVYEAKPDETQAVVSFYKPNRELFATKVVNKNTLFSVAKPETNDLSLVGYNTFLGWALGEDENEQPIMVEDSYEITGDLGVVAVFDGKKTVANFKVGSNEAADVYYGQEFIEHSTGGDNFSYWKRNNNIVSYNKTYTFYAWQDNAEVKSVVNGYEAAQPVAVLEKYGTTDSWMFEYEIPANCTRLEAGIIFGNSDDITIDSCYARAVSRRGAEDKHGQFTASSDYSVAKGYIIFKDSKGKTCVVYSK